MSGFDFNRKDSVRSFMTLLFLLSAPFSSFLFANRYLLKVSDILRYFFPLLCVIIIIYLLLNFTCGSDHQIRWGLISSSSIFLLFWYREVDQVVEELRFFDLLPIGIRGPIGWFVLFLIVISVVYIWSPNIHFRLFVFWLSLVITIVPLIQYSLFLNLDEDVLVPYSDQDAQLNIWDSTPDIYYLILDSFGRIDVLSELYNMDISDFSDSLKSDGFVIAENALAAHPITWLSVPAVLKQEYQADPSAKAPPIEYTSQDLVMSPENVTHRTLFAQGYEFITAAPPFSPFCNHLSTEQYQLCLVQDSTNLHNAVVRYQLARMTPLLGLADHGLLPNRISSWVQGLDLLGKPDTVGGKAFLVSQIHDLVTDEYSSPDSSPLFVVAHMMHAHPPFTLNSDCQNRTQDRVPDLSDWDDPDGYRMGLDCLQSQVSELLDAINPSAIVVLQADHGPLWEEPVSIDESTVAIWARTAVFSAVRLPPRCRSDVSDSFAGVNTFRLVFACLSHLPAVLEQERSYWTWYDDRSVTDVTDILQFNKLPKEG